MDKKNARDLAKALAVWCVRNTFLETLHAGKTAESRLGDYSDVKVITPTRRSRGPNYPESAMTKCVP